AANLAGGYFANIVFAALFLAALAVINLPTRRANTVATALLLLAGGLAHPIFFALGVAIIVAGALSSLNQEPVKARSALLASAGAAGGLLIGMASMLAGPRPLTVDTSADAFLRRAGLADSLAGEYLSRFVHHVNRYVLWLALPLDFVGRNVSPP